MTQPLEPVLVVAAAGLTGGLGMLARGLGGYRTSNRISDTAGATVRSVAAGEARLTGVVEAGEVLLTSPLQSRECVWYRATVDEAEGRNERRVFSESRGVGFRLRDASGTIRVLPRGARWAIPDQLDDRTGLLGDQPASLALRSGDAIAPSPDAHDLAVERLLTIRAATPSDPDIAALLRPGRRTYREARLEVGDVITIVGAVAPFADVPDGSNAVDGSFDDPLAGDPLADPAIAADLEEARSLGELAGSPDEAWGNAAIPGFGVGRPVRAPHLDPGATPLPLAPAAEAARTAATFEIAPTELVVAAMPDVPLLITVGAPGPAAAREERRFLVGLVGAAMAIVCATGLAVALTGGQL